MYEGSLTRRRILTLATLVAFTVSLTPPASLLAQEAETFRLPGDAVAVYNLAGTVQVRGGSGSEVAVTVRRRGSDAERLAVQTGRVDTRQSNFGSIASLRVVYPLETIVYGEGRGSAEVRVRPDGTFFGAYDEDRDDGRKIRIRNSGSGVKAHADLDIAVPNGRALYLALATGEVRIENVDGRLYVDVASADIRSSGGRGDFIFDTGSGDVEVFGHEGELVCDTGSGDVRMEDVSGGALTLDTGSGDVTGTRIRADRLIADTGSGDVELEGLQAERISADTGSGDVNLDLVASPAEILVDVGSGDVRIRVPEGFGATVEVDTGSGGIHTDLPIQVREIDDDRLRGVIGNASGRLRIDTGSGDVRIEQS
ncbi:MAG: DUF4097 family beta strand repeat-containing protein [Gemmatimonadota bacterium]